MWLGSGLGSGSGLGRLQRQPRAVRLRPSEEALIDVARQLGVSEQEQREAEAEAADPEDHSEEERQRQHAHQPLGTGQVDGVAHLARKVAACTAWGCSLRRMGLQPAVHGVAAWRRRWRWHTAASNAKPSPSIGSDAAGGGSKACTCGGMQCCGRMQGCNRMRSRLRPGCNRMRSRLRPGCNRMRSRLPPGCNRMRSRL